MFIGKSLIGDGLGEVNHYLCDDVTKFVKDNRDCGFWAIGVRVCWNRLADYNFCLIVPANTADEAVNKGTASEKELNLLHKQLTNFLRKVGYDSKLFDARMLTTPARLIRFSLTYAFLYCYPNYKDGRADGCDYQTYIALAKRTALSNKYAMIAFNALQERKASCKTMLTTAVDCMF